MKKILIAAVAVLVLFGAASSSFALICASDQVPAQTLLYPFVTGRFAPTATATNPVADRTAATTLFAITNVSSTPKIVHNVLWNDFSIPLLDWDVLLTGYDVITFNFADIMEGYLNPTGGNTYSPTGSQPLAQGPVPAFWPGIPSLPAPGGVGATANTTTSLYGMCTNPLYTQPFTIDTQKQANRIPEFNRSRVYNGLRKSQVIAENGWYGVFPPYFDPPTWLLNRSTADNVWAYITSDVVSGCGLSFPSDLGYFTVYAQPFVWDFYAGGFGGNTYVVELGNVLIGDWFVVDDGNNGANGSPAVHIEVDHTDVINSVDYPKTVTEGTSFYRYFGYECDPDRGYDDVFCNDTITGTGSGSDYTTFGDYFLGSRYINTGNFRESLPSAFAFRWLEGGIFESGTMLRVWKEFPDTYPFYGLTYIYSGLQYSYYAWDEQERVITVTGGCDYSPCPTLPGEINQLPLEVQEVSTENFAFPRTQMTFGWALFAFLGSNDLEVPLVPFGYAAPTPNVYGTQAWMEIAYVGSVFSIDMPAAVLGNYLCDGLSVATIPQNGFEVTDLGDVLY